MSKLLLQIFTCSSPYLLAVSVGDVRSFFAGWGDWHRDFIYAFLDIYRRLLVSHDRCLEESKLRAVAFFGICALRSASLRAPSRSILLSFFSAVVVVASISRSRAPVGAHVSIAHFLCASGVEQ